MSIYQDLWGERNEEASVQRYKISVMQNDYVLGNSIGPILNNAVLDI